MLGAEERRKLCGRDASSMCVFQLLKPCTLPPLPPSLPIFKHLFFKAHITPKASTTSLLPRHLATMASSQPPPPPPPPQAEGFLYFGPYKISSNEVFLTTDHSFAFVNLRPVVPGHVLVSSRRVVPRFLDLTNEEAIDLWLTAKQVGAKLEPYFNASSLTFAIQDGPQAGQTVPHVHIHILPRKIADFKRMDEVYDVMDEKEKEMAEKLDLDQERKDQTREEMAAEAAGLRALF